MKLTNAQILTLKAIAAGTPAEDGFVYGPFGRSAHSLVRRSLLECHSGGKQGWVWGFKLTPAGASLAQDE
jgi:hypothetical protein